MNLKKANFAPVSSMDGERFENAHREKHIRPRLTCAFCCSQQYCSGMRRNSHSDAPEKGNGCYFPSEKIIEFKERLSLVERARSLRLCVRERGRERVFSKSDGNQLFGRQLNLNISNVRTRNTRVREIFLHLRKSFTSHPSHTYQPLRFDVLETRNI